MHLVFSDIFDVTFMGERPHVKIGVLWENFYRIATIKKYYNVVAKAEEVVLVARDRKAVSDVGDVLDLALIKMGRNKT